MAVPTSDYFDSSSSSSDGGNVCKICQGSLGKSRLVLWSHLQVMVVAAAARRVLAYGADADIKLTWRIQ